MIFSHFQVWFSSDLLRGIFNQSHLQVAEGPLGKKNDSDFTENVMLNRFSTNVNSGRISSPNPPTPTPTRLNLPFADEWRFDVRHRPMATMFISGRSPTSCDEEA